MKTVYQFEGKAVKLGDVISQVIVNNTATGSYKVKQEVLLTKEAFTDFVNKGVITKEYICESKAEAFEKVLNSIPMMNVSDEVKKLILEVSKINRGATFSMILKELAVMLDEKYANYIGEADEIFCISLTNGRIFKLNEKPNTFHFAAFRNSMDARFALHVCDPILPYLFK